MLTFLVSPHWLLPDMFKISSYPFPSRNLCSSPTEPGWSNIKSWKLTTLCTLVTAPFWCKFFQSVNATHVWIEQYLPEHCPQTAWLPGDNTICQGPAGTCCASMDAKLSEVYIESTWLVWCDGVFPRQLSGVSCMIWVTWCTWCLRSVVFKYVTLEKCTRRCLSTYILLHLGWLEQSYHRLQFVCGLEGGDIARDLMLLCN